MKPVGLEILKTYIKANLASGFIRPFIFFVDTLLLFVQKKDVSFCLCIDYKRFNSLIIKNYYLQLLIY